MSGRPSSAIRSNGFRRVFSFPDPVNEVAARFVAGGVALMSVATIAFSLRWMLVVLAYGFVARTLTGPALSPLGQFVTRAVIPYVRIWPRPVPGRPKRFAQGIGATLTVTAVIAGFGFDQFGIAQVLVAMVAAAATSEAVFGFCVGCAVFARLMQWGVIPQTVCERCATVAPERRLHTSLGRAA